MIEIVFPGVKSFMDEPPPGCVCVCGFCDYKHPLNSTGIESVENKGQAT